MKFDTTDQASETRMALNGVAWPAGNPKALKVCFTQEEEMKKYQDASTEVGGKAPGEIGDKLTGVREWDKNKVGLDLTDLFRDHISFSLRSLRRLEKEISEERGMQGNQREK